MCGSRCYMEMILVTRVQVHCTLHLCQTANTMYSSCCVESHPVNHIITGSDWLHDVWYFFPVMTKVMTRAMVTHDLTIHHTQQ